MKQKAFTLFELLAVITVKVCVQGLTLVLLYSGFDPGLPENGQSEPGNSKKVVFR
jgi:hypothetical protein